jgi:hypothetical protein
VKNDPLGIDDDIDIRAWLRMIDMSSNEPCPPPSRDLSILRR